MGPLSTHRLQEADILTEGSNTATEGEQKHEDAHHDQQDGGVHSQVGQGCFWEKGLFLSLSLFLSLRVAPRNGWRCPPKCSPPLVGGCLVWLGEGYGEAALPSQGRTKRAQQGLWHLS